MPGVCGAAVQMARVSGGTLHAASADAGAQCHDGWHVAERSVTQGLGVTCRVGMWLRTMKISGVLPGRA
jgi:hypothetical protein